MAGHTFSGMTSGERFHEMMSGMATLAGALVTVIVVGSMLNHFLPSMPVLKHLMLTPPGQITDDGLLNSGKSAVAGGTEPVCIADRGVATSTLRPAGKAVFNDNYVDVVSEGAYIEDGTAVEVVRVAGNRVVVRSVGDA